MMASGSAVQVKSLGLLLVSARYTKPVDFEQLKAQLRQLPTAAD